MGTKTNPGRFDCFRAAEPNEPLFVLLARDHRAPRLVRLWAEQAEAEGDDPAKVMEARECALTMEQWFAEFRPNKMKEASLDMLLANMPEHWAVQSIHPGQGFPWAVHLKCTSQGAWRMPQSTIVGAGPTIRDALAKAIGYARNTQVL